MGSPNIGQEDAASDMKKGGITGKTITVLEEGSEKTIYNIIGLNSDDKGMSKNEQ